MLDFLHASDYQEELKFLIELFDKYTQEEIVEAFRNSAMCSETGVFKDVDVNTIDSKKAAEMKLEIYLEDGGLDIMDFMGLYKGDMKKFKSYAKKDIKSFMSKK